MTLPRSIAEAPYCWRTRECNHRAMSFVLGHSWQATNSKRE